MKELAVKWQFHGWLFDSSKEIENCGYMPKLGLQFFKNQSYESYEPS
jgi:hypothetical protein